MNLPDTPEVMITKLNEGICPFCNATGFKVVCAHIQRAHGIPADELKDALLISRDIGFASDDMRELLKERAKVCGFGGTNGTRPQEVKKWTKKSCHDPLSIEKMAKIKTGKSISESTRKKLKARGLPDITYARLSREFVNAIKEYGSYGVYERLSVMHNATKQWIDHRLTKCVEYGFLERTGKPYYPNGILTEKAISILEGESNG